MALRTPPRRGRFPSWALLALVLCGNAAAIAQVSPEESAKKMKPAPGLEATLWASEPMVVNPTAMDIDSRGRVWIAEGLNYRTTHGGGRRNFPRHPDADKIKILEDTDGDGKADKVTVFADKIWPIPMGLAVEEKWSKEGKYLGARVYVGNSPDILVFEDKDGDDKADSRDVLLTGFGGIDSDHGVHGMALGMDGKLYFTHGDGCCSYEQDHSHRDRNFDVTDKSGRHVWSDQLANTLRANRDGTQFEIIADRQRNNYETCLNSFGNIFTSDNDDDGNRGSRIIWVMDGAKYGYRTPGSPRHWGEDVPGNVPKLVGTGNGSPCGVALYEGSLLPKEYQGAVLEAEAGPRQVNYFPITRKGAAFRTEYKIMLASDDPWFRPVDVTAAPDGSVFVADWYDAGVGGHAFSDQTTGRIYRVAPTGVKTKKVNYDFATFDGLAEALQSPVVAAQDVARRLLIENISNQKKPHNVVRFTPEGAPRFDVNDLPDSIITLLSHGKMMVDKPDQGGDPINSNVFARLPDYPRARVFWVLAGINSEATRSLMHKLSSYNNTSDPSIRELLVRILGRDVSRTGKVEYPKDSAKIPLAAEANLDTLLKVASDPDAGVRRELILAFRHMPTSQVGEALKTLTKSWDGQDRWYLEALGLALKNREPEFLRELFDGNLFGDLNLAEAGKNGAVALPPYFPVDRNEAFISASDPEMAPANALTKTLGLAWMIHRPEVLPTLGKIMPSLVAPELQQAADDVIQQISGSSGAVTLAELAMNTADLPRRRQMLGILAKKLDGAWRDAQSDPKIGQVIEDALKNPETKTQGIQMAGATGNAKYADALASEIQNAKAPEEIRASAVEALARLHSPLAREILGKLIEKAKQDKTSSPSAEAAVRTVPRWGDARAMLPEIMNSDTMPLGLRREALRTMATDAKGARNLLAMAVEKKLPDALKTEAATVLRGHSDGNIRNEAMKAMPIVTASGKPLPSNGELIRREGHAERGREVFFKVGTTTCASCHRVQGRGQWIGPDLSTIGTKYGKDELLRSILNPSAAIGYNFRSLVVAMNDGQTLTGLLVEDSPEKLVIKTSEGKRVSLSPTEIEARKIAEISLMPEGLAQGLQEQDLVDLLAYLSTLKQPVSIVGQFTAMGPVGDTADKMVMNPTAKIDTTAPIEGAGGKLLSWRRVSANAEGLVDLVPMLGTDASKAAYLLTPVTSPVDQEVRVVFDTKADIKAWLAGKLLELPVGSEGEPRTVSFKLPKGSSELVIRMPGGNAASVVATFVSSQPIEFSPSEAKTSPN